MTYIEHLTASNALIADARHRIFFMLHDHHVLPHHYPEAERKRRDGILLRRGWDVAPRYTYGTIPLKGADPSFAPFLAEQMKEPS